MERESVLTIEVSRHSTHGYGQLTFRIATKVAQPLSAALAGCIGNAAGYGGGQTTADNQARIFADLIRRGYQTCYGFEPYEGPSFTLRWQEYDGSVGSPGYCAMNVEHGGSVGFGAIKATGAMLSKIAGRIMRADGRKASDAGDWAFENPSAVYAAIMAMGAERIETVETVGERWDSKQCEAKNERVSFRTDAKQEAA